MLIFDVSVSDGLDWKPEYRIYNERQRHNEYYSVTNNTVGTGEHQRPSHRPPSDLLGGPTVWYRQPEPDDARLEIQLDLLHLHRSTQPHLRALHLPRNGAI